MINRSAEIFVYMRDDCGAERRWRSDLRSDHAKIQCKILHHCSNCGWMITTFLQSSMSSLKMQMSDSPPSPPSPLLLHSWSLLFDLFIFYVGEPGRTMASFITEAVFPLPAPCSPPESLIYVPGQSDVTWSWRIGKETQKGKFYWIICSRSCIQYITL